VTVDPSPSWPNVHPDFDGHLERPLSSMSDEEKLDWLWSMMLFMAAAKPIIAPETREITGAAPPPPAR
jgi:hypothetical protein